MNVNVLSLLDRPIAFHRCFVDITGDVASAVFLSQANYWSQRCSREDGWFFKTAKEWQEETGLTTRQQERIRKNLVARGFLEEKLEGLPAVLHYRLVFNKIIDALLLVQQGKTSLDERWSTVSTKGGAQFRRNVETIYNTETTTENTTETTSPLIPQMGETNENLFPSMKEEKTNENLFPSMKEEKEQSKIERDNVEEVKEAWNAKKELPQVKVMTKGRKKALQARLKESFFVENYRAAIERIAASDFCLGKNNRDWKATIDWFIRPDTVAKVMEGKYDNRKSEFAKQSKGDGFFVDEEGPYWVVNGQKHRSKPNE